MTYRYLTPNMTGGLASKDILTRVDLDKYQTFLKRCKNGIIKPYGSVYKRNGTLYIDALTTAGNVRLIAFKQSDVDYLLEFTDRHLTVRRLGNVISEVDSPFTSDDLPRLKVTQSANTMFICSGRLPIMEIRNNNGTFTIDKLKIPIPPFDELQDGVNFSISNSTGDATLTSDIDFFDASTEAWGLKILQRVATKIEDVSMSSNTLGPILIQQNSTLDIWGSWTGTVTVQIGRDSNWTNWNTYTVSGTYTWGRIGNITIPSQRLVITVTSGTVHLRLQTKSDGVPSYHDEVQGSYSGSSTKEFFVGDSLNVLTKGTWTGTIILQRRAKLSEDFIDYRKYYSTSDYNVNESFTEDGDGHYYRLLLDISSGTATVRLTNYGYTNEGIAYIKEVVDSKNAIVEIQKSFATDASTEGYYISLFSAANGYPKCADFFQDRFVLANIDSKPNGIWFSKNGDYTNFDEVIRDGTLTDDSAINTSVVARNDYNIKNIIAAKDLCVFTGDDERIVSDGSTVTPTSINIRRQSSWGSTDRHVPFVADNRILYIQSNNKFLRDFGYTYETDGYTGNELTLFVHDFIDADIKDYAYAKYPENLIYFVLESGKIICLTYLVNEKVFAWSEIETAGKIEQIETVTENGADTIYTTVVRDGHRYLEKMAFDTDSTKPSDYVMLDCSSIFTDTEGQGIVIPRLANKLVWVVTSGDMINVKTQTADAEGNIVIEPPESGVYGKIIVGLPYEFVLELPAVHSTSKQGSSIGSRKSVTSVTMELRESYYGDVYSREGSRPNPIFSTIKDRLSALTSTLQIELFSGLVLVPLASDSNLDGGIIIKQDEPYPFKLLSIARDVDMS